MSTTAAPALVSPLANVSRLARWRPTGNDQSNVGTGGNANLSIMIGGTALSWAAAAGTGTRLVQVIDGEPVMEVVGSGTGVTLLRSTGWTPRLLARQGADSPSEADPVRRFLFRIGKAAGAAGSDFFGIYFHPLASTIPASPGTTGPGFGLTGDGAGGWQFISRKVGGGGLTIQTAVTGLTDGRLSDVEFRITPATGSVGASLKLLVNGSLFLTESWDAGRLAFYTDGLGGSATYTYSLRHQNAAYPNLYLGRVDEVFHAAAVS